MDILYMALAIAFLAVSWGLIKLCERLAGGAK
jgi:hypothetical protein